LEGVLSIRRLVIDSETFRSVLGRFASGVTIVTARDDNGADHGMTVSAFCSLSLDPPLVLVCIDHAASMHPLLASHSRIGINILESTQETYSRRFAAEEDDRFDGIPFMRGENGAVLISDALAHMECTIVEHHEAGDHTVFVARIDRAEPVATDGRPLLYYRGGYAQLER
jgi:flavin reductase (DIM6/NTAB) family NADH-FMN oxidoreductase RutF